MNLAPDFRGGLPPVLLHDIPARAAACWPDQIALVAGNIPFAYAALQDRIEFWAQVLRDLGVMPGDRVAVLASKDMDTVAAMFAVSHAHAVLVPVNPVLKAAQIQHILQDCGATYLVIDAVRYGALTSALTSALSSFGAHAGPLRQVILNDVGSAREVASPHAPDEFTPRVTSFAALCERAPFTERKADASSRVRDTELAAIFYTSGSTGRPKGVMLTHRNLVTGALSVAGYLENHAGDTLLAALPLSFDAGFSQLTTAFWVGARVVLLNYLLPLDVVRAMAQHKVTGLTAVPPLYAQLLKLSWPPEATQHLRYWANTGGRLPKATLMALQERAPDALPYLMFGLTEAFRATYLPPSEVRRRPDSIGKAIPHAGVFVLREDGSECDPEEPGELVQCGPLVAQGYWQRPEATAERFKPLPQGLKRAVPSHAQSEMAVFSGDTVRRDAEGFLYFVGRRDEMIKTSGYRVSPTEIEEVAMAHADVHEAVAVAVPDEVLGSVIRLVVHGKATLGDVSERARTDALLAHFRQAGPAYMVPKDVVWVNEPLPRNPNGKYDRHCWRDDARL